MPSPIVAALLCIFPALAIVAALRDLTSFTIPNWISLALALAFIPVAFLAQIGWGPAGMHLVVGLAGLFAGAGMFALGWIGGGDAKLFAAASLWLGWPAVVPFVLATGLAGGALAVGLLAMRTNVAKALTPAGAPGWTQRLMEDGGPAPYGVAIAAGALFAFPSSTLLTHWQGGL